MKKEIISYSDEGISFPEGSFHSIIKFFSFLKKTK